MDDAERSAWLAAHPDAGRRPRPRNAAAGDSLPSAVFAAGRNAVARVVPDRLAQTLAAAPDPAVSMAMAAAEAWLADDPSHALITLAMATIRSLASIIDPPPVAVASADASCSNRRPRHRRQPQLHRAQTAEAFAYSLARSGLTIVSGLRWGDAAAHRGALRAADEAKIAPTVAVLGTGIDVIYPHGKRALTTDSRPRDRAVGAGSRRRADS